jgi:hypothetical protein
LDHRSQALGRPRENSNQAGALVASAIKIGVYQLLDHRSKDNICGARKNGCL